MISSIGNSLPYYGQTQAQSGTASLSQTEEKLFAQIDSDGNGSISKSELTNFLDKVSGSLGGTQPSGAAASSLFTSMDSSADGSISLSEFQGNASSLADQLRSQLAQATSNVTEPVQLGWKHQLEHTLDKGGSSPPSPGAAGRWRR
jgi:hypothetical protein